MHYICFYYQNKLDTRTVEQLTHMQHLLEPIPVGDASKRCILMSQNIKYIFTASEYEAVEELYISNGKWDRSDDSGSDKTALAAF